MRPCDLNTIIIIGSVIIVIVALYVLYQRYEAEQFSFFQDLERDASKFIKSKDFGKFEKGAIALGIAGYKSYTSEPNTTCQLGGNTCTLSTGLQGICSAQTLECVALPLPSTSTTIENFEKTNTVDIKTLYSEPSLTCELGSTQCVLSTGKNGICDGSSDRCIQIPDSMTYKLTPSSYSAAPPIGEPSERCQWSIICTRSDGSMGSCDSGLCYPTDGYDVRNY